MKQKSPLSRLRNSGLFHLANTRFDICLKPIAKRKAHCLGCETVGFFNRRITRDSNSQPVNRHFLSKEAANHSLTIQLSAKTITPPILIVSTADRIFATRFYHPFRFPHFGFLLDNYCAQQVRCPAPNTRLGELQV